MEEKEETTIKEQPKSKSKAIIISLLVAAVSFIASYFMFKDLMVSIGISIITLGIVFIAFLQDKDITKENIRNELKLLSSDEIRSKIEYNKNFNEYGSDLIESRNELTFWEFVEGEIWAMISLGVMVLILGLFYLGAMPVYFGVDNVFLNPLNASGGLNTSLELVSGAGYSIISDFMGIGIENPTLWFWLWWFVVFMTFIFPIIRVIMFFIKRRKNKTKKEAQQNNGKIK